MFVGREPHLPSSSVLTGSSPACRCLEWVGNCEPCMFLGIKWVPRARWITSVLDSPCSPWASPGAILSILVIRLSNAHTFAMLWYVTKSCLTLWDPTDQPARPFSPWNFPSKNAGVGCHFLLHFLWGYFALCVCYKKFIIFISFVDVSPISYCVQGTGR